MNEKNLCPMCNKIAVKIVPLYDHDNAHKLQQCCQKCKKNIKKGIKIERFVRREPEEVKK